MLLRILTFLFLWFPKQILSPDEEEKSHYKSCGAVCDAAGPGRRRGAMTLPLCHQPVRSRGYTVRAETIDCGGNSHEEPGWGKYTFFFSSKNRYNNEGNNNNNNTNNNNNKAWYIYIHLFIFYIYFFFCLCNIFRAVKVSALIDAINVAAINALKYFNAKLTQLCLLPVCVVPWHETAACQRSVRASQTTRSFFSYL